MGHQHDSASLILPRALRMIASLMLSRFCRSVHRAARSGASCKNTRARPMRWRSPPDKVSPRFANLGVISVGQREDKVVDEPSYKLRCLLPRCVEPADADVFARCCRETLNLLRTEALYAAQAARDDLRKRGAGRARFCPFAGQKSASAGEAWTTFRCLSEAGLCR